MLPQPTYYIIATSGSRLLSLRVQNTFSASARLAIKPISKARGMLARMGSLFGGADLHPRGGINAVASHAQPRSQRSQTVWSGFAVTDTIIQEWRFSDSGEEVSILASLRSFIELADTDFGSISVNWMFQKQSSTLSLAP